MSTNDARKALDAIDAATAAEKAREDAEDVTQTAELARVTAERDAALADDAADEKRIADLDARIADLQAQVEALTPDAGRRLLAHLVSWATWDHAQMLAWGKACGIDAFLVDIPSPVAGNVNHERALSLAQAAAGGPISVVANLDANGAGMQSQTAKQTASQVARFYANGGSRIDGKPVLASFKAEGKSVAYWTEVLAQVERLIGERVRFIAVCLSSTRLAEYAPISYSLALWGNARPSTIAAAGKRNWPAFAEDRGCEWVEPIRLQDARHASGVFAEAEGFGTWLASWQVARDSGARFAQLLTVNDRAESTDLYPSPANGGSAITDLIRFFGDWWKTGTMPKVETSRTYTLARRAPAAGSVMKATLDGSGQAVVDVADSLVFTRGAGFVRETKPRTGPAATLSKPDVRYYLTASP